MKKLSRMLRMHMFKHGAFICVLWYDICIYVYVYIHTNIVYIIHLFMEADAPGSPQELVEGIFEGIRSGEGWWSRRDVSRSKETPTVFVWIKMCIPKDMEKFSMCIYIYIYDLNTCSDLCSQWNAYMKPGWFFVGFKVASFTGGRVELKYSDGIFDTDDDRWWLLCCFSLKHSATLAFPGKLSLGTWGITRFTTKLYQSHITGRQNFNMTHQSCLNSRLNLGALFRHMTSD